MLQIGQGTYSSVYRARDLETGKIVALKKVRFINMDPESVRFMAREILILRRLDHPNVMKLEGLVTSRVSGNLYLVFEYMEHDLTGLVASSTVKFTEPQVCVFSLQPTISFKPSPIVAVISLSILKKMRSLLTSCISGDAHYSLSYNYEWKAFYWCQMPKQVFIFIFISKLNVFYR